ncbi:MAG: DNA polymerase III subunit delta [Candidatus Nealsonbacteria bacterium]|nr:DNA polymerase III subunit delta [Candidatus Nealsonbacteria bacterium]
MIFFLYGRDNFRSRKKLKEIIEQYQKVRQHGLNFFHYDSAEDSFDNFRDQSEARSLFGEKRLFVMENVLTDRGLSQSFLTHLQKKRDSTDILIFFEGGDGDSKNPLFVFLKKTAQTQEFEPLDLPALKSWIRQAVKEQGAEIDSLALDRLAALLGNDLWLLSNEIGKLASLKDRQKIEVSDINSLARPKIEVNIFKTIEEAARGDRKKALGLIGRHLAEGDSPVYLLAMINYQFRNLLLVKGLLEKKNSPEAIAKLARLNPFVARQCSALSQKFTFSRLKEIYSQILDTDFKIKTGKVSPRQGLELLISGI